MKKLVSALLVLIGIAAFSGAYACDGKGSMVQNPSGPVVQTPSGTSGT